MAWVSENKKQFDGNCCGSLVTTTLALLPFQIVSKGDYIKAEISPYGESDWTEVTLSIDTVISEGYFIHSYNGAALPAPLTCGMYDFRVTAGEMWYFEPISVEDFEITTTAFTLRDLIMAPLKFSESQVDGIPIIAPCDRFLPFMFATENATSGSITVYLYDSECTAEEITITVDVLTIDGKTYYIHDGACFTPLLECGLYKLEIVDGGHSYMSVWFEVECGISDIPDGSVVLRDFNGCVMRDEFGNLLYEDC